MKIQCVPILMVFLLACSWAQAADRYWVDGSGTWDASDTTHWSESSGGASGASVPTSSDNVYFDAASFSADGATVTLGADANALALDFTGLDQTVTLTSSVSSLNVYGDLSLHATKLTWTFTGTAYLYSKGSGTYRTNGMQGFRWNYWKINGTGITIDLGDDFSSYTSVIINPTNGTLNTNNYNLSTGQIRFQTGTSAMNCGSSTITLQQFWRDGGTVTFDAGTSTFVFNQGIAVPAYGPLYNATFNYNGTGGYVELWGNLTVTNNLVITGADSTTKRLIVRSNTIGSQRTITVPAVNVTASNVDFRDIRFANAVDLSAITGLSGDAGGNSGITFTTAVPQFFKHTSGAVNWSDSTKWFTATNGGGSAGRVPLPQDDATFDANSFSGTSTLTVNCPRIGRSLDMSGVNQAVTMTLANAVESYGSHVLGNNITASGSYTKSLMGRGSFVLNLYDKSHYAIDVSAFGGTYTNMAGFALSYGFIGTTGTFDFNDFNTSMRFIQPSGLTLYLGNGTLTFTTTLAESVFTSSPVAFYAEGSTIKLTASSGANNITFAGGGRTYNKVWFSGAHTGNFDITGSNTISQLVIDAGRKVRFTAGTTTTVSSLTAVGTAASPITISSVTNSTHTISVPSGRVDVTYANIAYSAATGGATFRAHASTDSGNNSGWTFVVPRFWVGGTGTWDASDTTHWASSSGGAGGASVPTSSNDVYFDANSFSVDSSVISVNAAINAADIDFSAIDQTATLSSASYALSVYGSIALSNKLTWAFSNTAYTYFKATSSVNMTMNGCAPSFNRLYMDGVGGKWTLQDNMSTGIINPWYFVNGEFDTNNKNITVVSGDLSWQLSAGTKKLTLGSSIISLGNGVAFGTSNDAGLTIDAGTSTIKVTGDWFTGATKTFNNIEINTTSRLMGGGVGGFTAVNLSRTSGNNTVTNLPLSTNITITGTLTLTGANAGSARLLVNSTVMGTQRIITVPAVGVTASNVDFRDIRFANAVDLSAITGLSGDAGGNSGITFTTAVPQFFKHTSGAVNWSDSTKWFTATNGGGSAGRVPLPQDDATFDASSFSGTSTLTVNCPRIGRSLDMTGVNQAVTMSVANDIESYGSFVLYPNISINAPAYKNIHFLGRGDFNVSTFNKSSGNWFRYRFNSIGGKYTFQSDFFFVEHFALLNGTLDFNDFNVTGGVFGYFTNASGTTLYMGNGTITMSRNYTNLSGGWWISSDLTLFSEGSHLITNVSSGATNVRFDGAGKTYNKVQFSGTYTGFMDITGSNTFNQLIIDPGRKVRFTGGTTTTVSSIIWDGTADNPIDINVVSGTTPWIISRQSAGQTFSAKYLTLDYSTASQADTFYAGSNSVDGGHNTSWIFGPPPGSGGNLMMSSD